METEEVIKLVDNIYKNILEKFNPGARQLISAGKAYLKALHGAAAASRLFNEALAKIAVNAQQGGTTDIGSALMNIVGVYKEIQDQHMNILKAFYVDLLVPLETNLEKDTKVVQFEQKKFLQQHKIRADSYSKAAATMKKQRKKKNNSQNSDKEIKTIQALDEEKNKLDAFCEQSLKNAMTQERRRYGFVLERQCSLAKHWMAYHIAGRNFIANQLDNWEEVSSSREFLPPNMENIFARQMIDNDNDNDSDRGSIVSALRKTRSIDASCLDMRSIVEVANSSNNMPRAKSEYNLTSSTQVEPPKWDQRTISRGLYAYLSSGENQLSFLEGDRIALVGDRAKGWQFGENLRTQTFGWFPVAYTELEHEDNHTNWGSANQRNSFNQHLETIEQTPDSSLDSSTIVEDPPMVVQSSHKSNAYHDDASPTRMFGDTIMYRQSKQFRRVSGGGAPKPGPPPTLPAPVPTPVVPASYPKNHLSQSHSFSSTGGPPTIDKRKSMPISSAGHSKQQSSSKPKSRNGVTNASLHSSNDSGFANDPPPQPDIDYSDEETLMRVPIRSHHTEKSNGTNKKSRIPRRSHESDSNTLQSTKAKSYRSSNSHHGGQINNSNHYNTNNIRQSSSWGNLADESDIDFLYRTTDRKNGNIIKRTKSFWKFGKNDDILEGMSLWKHRDLVLTENEKNEEKTRESTLKRQKNTEVNSISTNSSETLKNVIQTHHSNSEIVTATTSSVKQPREQQQMMREAPVVETTKRHSNNNNGNSNDAKYHFTKSEIDQRISMQKEENLYGVQKSRSHQNLSGNSGGGGGGDRGNRGKMMRQNYIETEQEPVVAQETRRQARSDKHKSSGRTESKIPYSSKNVHGKTKKTTSANTSSNNNNNNHMSSNKNSSGSHGNNNHSNNNNDNSMSDYYDTRENLDSMTQSYDDSSLIMNSNSVRVRDTNFYDDESVDDMLMKTVKRQEILKQYYSSGTDTERNSSSSDPYDCIVVDDHLARRGGGGGGGGGGVGVNDRDQDHKYSKNAKMDFKTFRSDDKDSGMESSSRTATLLPRTKLTKSSSGGQSNNSGQQQSAKHTSEKQQQRRGNGGVAADHDRSNIEHDNKRSSHNMESKSYGPWYDLWGGEIHGNVQK